MKKEETKKTEEEFVSYEEARIEKDIEDSEDITDEEVESANKILYPDKNSMDSRG